MDNPLTSDSRLPATGLAIRPARPDDRPAMERICAHTWEWGDYLPQVWDHWLADPAGPVLVGERAGRVVALSKITFQPEGQVWLEGMRVDPEYRRQGIARQFLDHSLTYARQHGARVVRLGTGSHNEPVHRMAAHAGMERVGAYLLWTAGPLPDNPGPTILTPAHAAQVQALLTGGSMLAHTHGLCNVRWTWQEFSPTYIARLLAAGQMVAQPAPDGSLAALAAVPFDPEDETLWIGLIEGQPDAIASLATAIRGHAARIGAARIQVMLPGLDWLQDLFRTAGYGPGDWQGELWIFERRLG